MAEEHKKSFLLYFDMYPSIRTLSLEQKGRLLEALFEYAWAAAEQGGQAETVLAHHPEMSPECRMAFHFVAETIRRDTEKWREKHRRYSEAAKIRCKKGQGAAGGGNAPDIPAQDQEAWKYV